MANVNFDSGSIISTQTQISQYVCAMTKILNWMSIIIKGNSNANRWARSPGKQHAKLYQNVTKKFSQQQGIKYTVQEEEQYYITSQLHSLVPRPSQIFIITHRKAGEPGDEANN